MHTLPDPVDNTCVAHVVPTSVPSALCCTNARAKDGTLALSTCLNEAAVVRRADQTISLGRHRAHPRSQ